MKGEFPKIMRWVDPCLASTDDTAFRDKMNSLRQCLTLSISSVNRADGISEIEGKAAKGSGERVGKGASFKSVVNLNHEWHR